jgi:uncharacterized protein with FMN-binding domain
MRKSIVIILAVAIIGALGVYTKSGHSASSADNIPAAAAQPAVAGASTSSNVSPNASDAGPASPNSGAYKDGSYTGRNEPTPYGDVQISVIISGGRISGINFLRMPSDAGHSREVTAFSEPLLKNITLSKQSAHIDFVSGATQTSEAYQASLQYALDQAA